MVEFFFFRAIMQSRLRYESIEQMDTVFGKKEMEIKKENAGVENERKTNGRNGRKVEGNSEKKVRK